MKTHSTSSAVSYRDGRFSASSLELADEVPVAISYNGSTHAVLMATPSDLEDLSAGFSLSENIVASPEEIEDIAVVEVDKGIDVQIRLATDATERLRQRRRSIAGPVGCGLCGIESLEEAMREIRPVMAETRLKAENVGDAVRAMGKAQALNLQTRSVHAAGWYHPEKGLTTIREDVGRHNALDKLIGSMSLSGTPASGGAFVMSSRLSIELIQKTAAAGCGIIIAVSAPTALAVSEADGANITLVACARGDSFELFTHPHRIIGRTLQDVA
ncbi:formate dehydrogenase accessory sulfurtransferase FdhD [uncultured Roseibium sp.]|uniref:formate dehydrogenase accessory sulfurtransferase FdhD n=1 Tax=uncultured Roseibium sp. TaxID=1936171 RepID=UPI00262A9872|nr:formate dehydrogenase accessory sulfurtransferase FdhD [uncultured Roseibium sp.]